MRVLIVSHSGKTSGGAEQSLMALVRCVARERADVRLTMLFPGDGQSALRAFAERLGVETLCAPYHRLCFAKTNVKPLRYGKLALLHLSDRWRSGRLAKRLRGRFDMVYSNTSVVFFGAFLARRLRLPHVWHIREFGREYGIRFLPGADRCRDRLTDRFLFTSRALLDSYRGRCREEKMRVVYNGIAYRPGPARKEHDGIHMLHIAGNFVDTEERDRILDFVRRASLEEKVVFHGYVEDMPALRSQMDMELICSQCEGFGRSTVEGMMSGLTVIAADCGATPEILRDRETGFLYPPGDLDRFVELIATLAEDAALRDRVGRAAQKDAIERFTLERYAAQVVREWEEVCAD